MFGAGVTEDGHYLIISIDRGTEPKNLVFYKDLAKPDSPIVELINEFEASYSFIDNDGSIFWFRTDLDAPRGRVIGIDIRNPARESWQEVIPQAVETLESVGLLNNQFVTDYLKDAHSSIKIFNLDGALSGR